jgi:ribosomal protein S18 acetylase RimI-like enzyme
MSVAPSARGKGVARALFSALKRFCAEKEYMRIVLSTSSLQAAACHLYPSLGFEAEHRAPIGRSLPERLLLPGLAVTFFSVRTR